MNMVPIRQLLAFVGSSTDRRLRGSQSTRHLVFDPLPKRKLYVCKRPNILWYGGRPRPAGIHIRRRRSSIRRRSFGRSVRLRRPRRPTGAHDMIPPGGGVLPYGALGAPPQPPPPRPRPRPRSPYMYDRSHAKRFVPVYEYDMYIYCCWCTTCSRAPEGSIFISGIVYKYRYVPGAV